MAKSGKPSASQIDYMHAKLAEVEKDRAQRPSEDEIAQILVDLGSPDPAVRGAALRRICPCHLEWAVFEPLRKAAKQLQQDPDPTVRALAIHVEEDTAQIASLEALRDLLEEEDGGQDLWKQQERKRNKPRHRKKSSKHFEEV